MDVEAVRQAAEHASPVALAYVTKARTTRQSILFGTAFTLGMVLVQVLLGFVAGLSGSWVEQFAGRQWGLLLGPVLIVLGFIWAWWVRVPLPSSSFKAKR